MRLIDADDLREMFLAETCVFTPNDVLDCIDSTCTIDAVPVVRCKDCIYSVPLDRNCELNEIAYLHCTLWRGEETKNVWHKYKKYYKDYSLVDRDGFCNQGTRREEGNDGSQAR